MLVYFISPSRRFAWTGLDTFGQLFGGNAGYSFAIGEIFKWTILWAVLATFTNYIGGMILALLINKKELNLKRFGERYLLYQLPFRSLSPFQ